MKSLYVAMLLALCTQANAFDILAFGTSATNCHGVARDKIIPVKLEEKLTEDGFVVQVINAGIDGDKPVWMLHRLKTSITPETKIVILEPGPNERNPSYALPYIEEMLAYLKELNMPVLYAANRATQTEEEGSVLAKKYGAYFYGHFGRNVPIDRIHRQFDYPSTWGGHMTAEGCAVVANSMAPELEKILIELNLK